MVDRSALGGVLVGQWQRSTAIGALMSDMSGFQPGFSVVKFILQHPANSDQKVSALLSAMKGRLAMALAEGKAIEINRDGITMRVRQGDTSALRALYAWPPDQAEMLAWKRLLTDGDLFVDVGANAGVYSLWAATCGATVIAFEPDERICQTLKVNASLNGFDIALHTVALSDSDGELSFSTDRGAANRIAMAVDHDVTMVQTRRLDDILPREHIRGMKIDVEGFEMAVLRGSRTILEQKRVDAIQLEWNALSLDAMGHKRGAVADFLEDLGYQLFRPDANGHLEPVTDANVPGSDVFALNPDVWQILSTTS
jgi:FkbM family methyltransferase